MVQMMMANWVETCSVYIWNKDRRMESGRKMHVDAQRQTYRMQQDAAMNYSSNHLYSGRMHPVACVTMK
jgi:hypothetical protein